MIAWVGNSMGMLGLPIAEERILGENIFVPTEMPCRLRGRLALSSSHAGITYCCEEGTGEEAQ
jgi:hypothetical protein